MQQTISRVQGGRLYPPERSGAQVVVGTSAWYDWLGQHTAFTFVDRIFGYFTARKRSTVSGEFMWEASLVRARKLYRVVLGPSHTLTLSKLQSVAQTLASPYVPAEWADVSSSAEPVASQPPAPQPAIPISPRSSFTRTKLYRPRTSNDVIPRTRLIERLNAGLGSNVTLVCAPAGFGKTTLLAEWARTLERKVAWLSLDETDNELAVFVHSLTAAVQNVLPDACQATASLFTAPQFPSSERSGKLLGNDLADMPEDVLLVLDDYHLIHTIEVHTLLELLIRHLPPQVHLVLATRVDPSLPLIRWRAQGHLNELHGADLCFTLEETEMFLARILGNDLAQQTAGQMKECTEGWIAMLRLAALSLRTASHPATFLERLRNQPDRSISRYLLEEILAQQAPAVQELLARMSILDQFCPELCTAIMNSNALYEQVQVTLDWLERTNVFLVPLDEHQQWYRFHPLFKLLLQQRLQAHMSHEEIIALHRRASAWYAAQGLIDEALRQALAAGDASYAARLVEAQFLGAFEQEQWIQMERWLRLLPEDQIHGSPGLLIARVWILQAHGQFKDVPHLLTAAEQLLGTNGSAARDPGDPQSKILRALIAIGWSMVHFFAGQVQASLRSAESALEWIRPGEAHVAIHALYFLVNQATGHEEVAMTALNKALRESSAHLNDSAHLLFAQAIMYLTAGKLPQAEQAARHLLRLARDADLALSLSWAHWLLGIVYYEWNRLYAAAYHFTLVIADRHRAHFWAVRDAMCGLALAYQAQGFDPQAQETTDGLLKVVQEEHNLGEIMTAYAFCGQLALLQGEVESAEQWLELSGEQEVLDPMIFFEAPTITKARLLLAKGDGPGLAQGQALLDKLLHHVEAIHSTRKTVQVLALQALAYDLQGREAEALDILERALVLALPGGFVRTFTDMPLLAKMLQGLRKRRKAQQELDRQLDTYLQRLLAVMSPLPPQAVATEKLLRQEGLEPLTERELQVLHLLDKDLTNKEIARALVLTPGTVKVYTNNVYRKLSVNNRRAAVSLSKALGLLAGN